MIVTVASPPVEPDDGVMPEIVGAGGTNWNPVGFTTEPPESVIVTGTLPIA
jgi:hypothetical protein